MTKEFFEEHKRTLALLEEMQQQLNQMTTELQRQKQILDNIVSYNNVSHETFNENTQE